jgi:hypothetical protein
VLNAERSVVNPYSLKPPTVTENHIATALTLN